MLVYDWDRSYQDVGIVWEPKIVRVLNDAALEEKLKNGNRTFARQLAGYAIERYRQIYGCSLKISERSLACEIYWHAYISMKSSRFEHRHGEKRLTRWLLYHMDVIDCGERDVDNNRFLWDFLAVVF